MHGRQQLQESGGTSSNEILEKTDVTRDEFILKAVSRLFSRSVDVVSKLHSGWLGL
jgi:hypothetical protein